jgi:Flp pilus assembly protein TadD
LRQDRIDDAIPLFERARHLDAGVGRDAFAMRRFATALMTRHRMADAERVLAEAALANPSDVALQKLWGRSLAVDGRFAAAAERFYEARRLAPDDTEARQLVDAIERRTGLARR